MTDRDVDAAGTAEQERPSTEEAAEIVRNDPALAKATEHSHTESSAQSSSASLDED